MVEKQIEETKRKELVHIKHIWVFICPIFVQLLYNFLLTCSLGLCDVYSRYYSDGINYILVSNEKSTKFVLGVPNLKFYKSNWQLPFYVVRYFICFLSNKAVALSLLLEQRQGLLLIHSKRTGGGRILLFNAIMIYEPSSLFIFLFLCIHWSRNNEQMAEWLPPSSSPPRGASIAPLRAGL